MRKEEMDHSRRRRDRASPVRNEDRENSGLHPIQKNFAQNNHDREAAGHKRHHRYKEESLKRSMEHQSNHSTNKRREWRNRNSPVEIGRRQNADGGSSSETDLEQRQGNTKHSSHNKKRACEESFEELSRQKKRIESELIALDAEEAKARRKEKGKGQVESNRNNAHKRKPSSNQQEERFPCIKVEPHSDDETARRRRRPSGGGRRRQQNSEPRDGSGEWGRPEKKEPTKPKEKPSFQTSGKLAEDTNTYNGVVIKYNEPSEARKPKRKWRLYPFKGDHSLPFIPVHRQSAYLLGRTRLIADIPIDHPSCSKQHAVLQFRLLPYEREDGTTGRSVRPYIIDLDSSNGTYVNNKRVDPRRYVELLEKDVLKFGFSTRVYVILHEDSKNEEENDEGDS